LAKLVVYAVLPALALLIACGAGYLKWKGASVREADAAAVQAGQVAGSTSMTLLSYEPNTAEQNLSAARDLLTGTFKDSYTALTNDVVIPGAKEKQVSSRASIAAVARVSATPTHYVGLVFIDQTVVIGTGAPTVTASSVRVTLDKVGDRWLMSGFDPV
jgi:Mce-associated membrane protein